MVSIQAENLSLRYPLPFKFGISSRRPALPSSETEVGGLVNRQDRGRKRNVDALRNVSFELTAGDRLGLVGNNGAGKTTLLKTLYGIYPPTGGAVRTNGRVDALFNINLGFRREATGRRNITLRGLINGWSPELIAAQMEEIVEFSELGEFIDLPFKAYSSGMAARLAFAMATSFKPEILLMDEWIGAGDKSFQKKAKGRMDAIAAEAGIIVLASHNNKLLQRTCNKILVLEKGMVKSFGSAEEHFAAPSNSDEDYLS